MNQLTFCTLPMSPLENTLRRDFGSIQDFRRSFFHTCGRGGETDSVWLLLSARGVLQLVLSPQHHVPRGYPLFRVDLHQGVRHPNDRAEALPMRRWHTINWSDAEKRYQSRLRRTPLYPTP